MQLQKNTAQKAIKKEHRTFKQNPESIKNKFNFKLTSKIKKSN